MLRAEQLRIKKTEQLQATLIDALVKIHEQKLIQIRDELADLGLTEPETGRIFWMALLDSIYRRRMP